MKDSVFNDDRRPNSNLKVPLDGLSKRVKGRKGSTNWQAPPRRKEELKKRINRKLKIDEFNSSRQAGTKRKYRKEKMETLAL
jgi:hypothetical protein